MADNEVEQSALVDMVVIPDHILALVGRMTERMELVDMVDIADHIQDSEVILVLFHVLVQAYQVRLCSSDLVELFPHLDSVQSVEHQVEVSMVDVAQVEVDIAFDPHLNVERCSLKVQMMLGLEPGSEHSLLVPPDLTSVVWKKLKAFEAA